MVFMTTNIMKCYDVFANLGMYFALFFGITTHCLSMGAGVCKNIIAPHCGCRHKYHAAVKLYAIIL